MSEAEADRPDADNEAFLSLLIHELRTPLTALRGSLGLLASAVEDATPEIQQFAAIADRNAARLAALLDEAGEFARLENPAASVQREATDVAQLVQQVVEQAQSRLTDRGATVDVTASSVEASLDPALVRLAVFQLLSYALRVSAAPAAIRIGVATPDAKTVNITISDSGRTIDAVQAARILEPFSPAARRGEDRSMRVGLGLAIARRIAVLHGGELRFEATDRGGLFSLRLPIL